MQKINFQDTVVVKTPYVEINGTEYEVKSEYEGGTDLDATVFNTMQNNIETAINEKQDVLIGSGEGQNIKTINNNSILGTGNINTCKLDTIWSGSQTTTGNITLDEEYTDYDMLVFTICPGDTNNKNNATLMTAGIATGASHFLTAFQDTNAYINFNISFVDSTHINVVNIYKSTNWSSLTAYLIEIVGIKFGG